MPDRVFTGDTLLIRGTGRTDFQNGDPRAQYESLFNRLLKLPDDTLVYPAHDYKGDTVSTIGEEKAFNPRLQVKSVDEYVDLMNNLNLPNPKMMDVAVPANMKVGLAQEEIAGKGWALTAEAAFAALVAQARRRADRLCAKPASASGTGEIPGLAARAYRDLVHNIRPGGMLHELGAGDRQGLLFYCAFGERSAMAVQAAQAAGLSDARHIHGGLQAWQQAGGSVTG
jgi:sulfur dioxygenase